MKDEKIKISNSELADKYYSIVNSKIELYVKDHKIDPVKLKNYFRNEKKMDSFLKSNNLDNVIGIKRVFNDVIDDYYSSHKDQILKFESFKTNEDMGFFKVDNSNIEHEKVLADYYNTSVGYVEVINKEDHSYKVTDLGEIKYAIIYSHDELHQFKDRLIPNLIRNSKDENLELISINSGLKSEKSLKCNIQISLSEILSEDLLKNKLNSILTVGKIIQILTNLSNDYDILKNGKKYVFIEEYKKYYIWELRSK